ncbi:MAG TPA: AraC family transcriptional regulator [Flavitalea sp.]|nr:AraC family transcriptional regulator [Flavitalea sp.]
MNNTYDYLSSRPNEFKQLAVKDILFLHYICPQVDKYLNLFNHFNQISFTLGGDKILHRNSKTWYLTEHSSLFAKKAAWKQEIGTAGWEILSFYIPDQFLYRFFKENRHRWPLNAHVKPPSDVFIEVKVNETTRAFFYSLLPYFDQQPAPPEELLELKFRELLFNILSNPENFELLAYLNDKSDQDKTPIYEVMEENYFFNLTIPDFARLAQRSVTTFKRDFFHYYKMTPGKWLTIKRLNHATLLLNTTHKNVYEIASDSGFENVTHFDRVFKENYDVSPSQYRKRNSLRSTS